jgi:hypothetical protein
VGEPLAADADRNVGAPLCYKSARWEDS